MQAHTPLLPSAHTSKALLPSNVARYPTHSHTACLLSSPVGLSQLLWVPPFDAALPHLEHVYHQVVLRLSKMWRDDLRTSGRVQCGVCTVWGVYSVGVYSVGSVQCGVCSVGCVQCGVCTVWGVYSVGVYSVGCVQCGECTVWGVYSVGCVQCGACTVWGV